MTPPSASWNGLQRLFRRSDAEEALGVVETLREVSLFEGFSRRELRDLAAAVHERSYKRDEFLYYEEDPGLGLYVVQRGRVRLLTEDEQGNVYELRQVAEKGYFGEISILGDFRRMETAQAVTETQVLGFFSPDLKTMLKRNPRTGATVVMALARSLAARQVELVRRVSAGEGKMVARRLLGEAKADAE